MGVLDVIDTNIQRSENVSSTQTQREADSGGVLYRDLLNMLSKVEDTCHVKLLTWIVTSGELIIIIIIIITSGERCQDCDGEQLFQNLPEESSSDQEPRAEPELPPEHPREQPARHQILAQSWRIQGLQTGENSTVQRCQRCGQVSRCRDN